MPVTPAEAQVVHFSMSCKLFVGLPLCFNLGAMPVIFGCALLVCTYHTKPVTLVPRCVLVLHICVYMFSVTSCWQ